MDDGFYLSDLLFWVYNCKKKMEKPKTNWELITEISNTMLTKTKEFYLPPKCPMEYDQTVIDRGKVMMGKLETLNNKIKDKDKQATVAAIADVESQLKSFLH